MSLIRYTYEITGDITEEEEPLRKLVMTFAALYISQFKGTDVDDLMRSPTESNRDFVVDLMAKIRTNMEGDQTSQTSPDPDDYCPVPDNYCFSCGSNCGGANGWCGYNS